MFKLAKKLKSWDWWLILMVIGLLFLRLNGWLDYRFINPHGGYIK